MECFHIPEHRRCENYESDKAPMVEIIQDVENFERDSTHTFIVYILYGTISISYGTVPEYTLAEGDFMLFPPGIRITGRLKNPVKTLLLRIDDRVSLCDKYTLENIYHGRDMTGLRHTHLAGNQVVKRHMEGLAECVSDGLRCNRFLIIKLQELFYYLRVHYSKDELARFNLSLLGTNSQFMDFVWKNYRRAHNVKQLAQLANCSVDVLKEKFKRITGMPAGEWLAEQKARNIHHDIYCGQKTLKEICAEYGFCSPSHLGAFCQKKFGKSPGRLKPGKNDTGE